MGKTALVVIDLQNAFVKKNTLEVVQKIRNHLETCKYDYVIFSKFVNSPDSNFVKKLGWHKCKDSHETDLAFNPSGISKISKSYVVFEKHTYSIFKSKEFRDFLEKNKVTKLYFCGLDLEACVLASVFDAFDLDYDYEILMDLSASSAGEDMISSAAKIIGRNL